MTEKKKTTDTIKLESNNNKKENGNVKKEEKEKKVEYKNESVNQQTGLHLKMVNEGEVIGTLDVGSDEDEEK